MKHFFYQEGNNNKIKSNIWLNNTSKNNNLQRMELPIIVGKFHIMDFYLKNKTKTKKFLYYLYFTLVIVR